LQSLFGNLLHLRGVVKFGSDGIASGPGCVRCAATTAAFTSQGRLPVFFLNDFLDICAALLFADFRDVLQLERFVPGAALRIEKLQQFLEH
jgi:hypothetical protein